MSPEGPTENPNMTAESDASNDGSFELPAQVEIQAIEVYWNKQDCIVIRQADDSYGDGDNAVLLDRARARALIAGLARMLDGVR